MKKFFKEFKEFIAKGNVMDMAVAVVVGGAFKEKFAIGKIRVGIYAPAGDYQGV